MIASGGSRLRWAELPPGVRAGVESILRSRVVEAVSQPGGFSPGSADRVVLASGRRAFVKAIESPPGGAGNPMILREGVINGVLPAGTPAPAFLGSVTVGAWQALCFADVEGRHPSTPWRDEEILAVLAALDTLASLEIDPSLLPNPPADQLLAADFAAWEQIAASPAPDLPPLAGQHLDELRELARQAPAACRGTSLCHLDVRADNLLIDGQGQVFLVDWPWAAIGAPWLDSANLLVNVGLYGGHDLESLVAASPRLASAPRADLDAFLSGLAAFFVVQGRLPDPAGMPTLRAFQRQQGDVVLAWLARRLGW